MRSIAFYSPGWPVDRFPNGIVTYLAHLRPALEQAGCHVTILTPENADPSDPEVLTLRARASVLQRLQDQVMYRLRPRRWPVQAQAMRIRDTLIHHQQSRGIEALEIEESFGWARWIAPRSDVPVVLRLHGPWFLNGTANGEPEDADFIWRDQSEGIGLRSVRAMTAPSQHVLDAACARFGVKPELSAVIPNPVPPAPAEARWSLEACEKQTILFVGRFDRHKGGDLMIEAFARVLQKKPEATLLFVGPDRGVKTESGQRISLEQQLAKSLPDPRQRQRVQWLDRRPNNELPPLRRRALVTVVASRYENFPLTAVEAMAQGCPLVASRTGGLPEIVQHEHNGLLFEPASPEALAGEIVRLMDDPALAAQLGSAGRIDCENRYHPDRVAQMTLDFYADALGRRQSRKGA